MEFISLLNSGFWSVDCFLCSNGSPNVEFPFPSLLLQHHPCWRSSFSGACLGPWPWTELDEVTNLMEKQVLNPPKCIRTVVFPTAPCIPVLAEYMVGKAPETLVNEEKWEILIPAVSTALMDSTCPLCCWVIVNICLEKKQKKNLLDCSQRSCQSSHVMSVFKNGSSGFQGRQPIASVRSAHGQKSNIELPCFLVEQDFTPDFQCC